MHPEMDVPTDGRQVVLLTDVRFEVVQFVALVLEVVDQFPIAAHDNG